MLVRCLDHTGALLNNESFNSEMRTLIQSIEEMVLPVYSGAWKHAKRDVSSMMLNDMFNIAINRKSEWKSEHKVDGGFIDFAKQCEGFLIAMEVELGTSARLDSDILKLCLLKNKTTNTIPILAVPSSIIKKRCHTGFDGDGAIRRIKQLKPILPNVEHIIVLEFGIPNAVNSSPEHIYDFSKLQAPIELFTRSGGGTKIARKDFIFEHPDYFFLGSDFCSNCLDNIDNSHWCDCCGGARCCERCWVQKKVGNIWEGEDGLWETLCYDCNPEPNQRAPL